MPSYPRECLYKTFLKRLLFLNWYKLLEIHEEKSPEKLIFSRYHSAQPIEK